MGCFDHINCSGCCNTGSQINVSPVAGSASPCTFKQMWPWWGEILGARGKLARQMNVLWQVYEELFLGAEKSIFFHLNAPPKVTFPVYKARAVCKASDNVRRSLRKNVSMGLEHRGSKARTEVWFIQNKVSSFIYSSPRKGYPARTMWALSFNLSLHHKRSWVSSCATETLSFSVTFRRAKKTHSSRWGWKGCL